MTLRIIICLEKLQITHHLLSISLCVENHYKVYFIAFASDLISGRQTTEIIEVSVLRTWRHSQALPQVQLLQF